jgi:hypothetical protein
MCLDEPPALGKVIDDLLIFGNEMPRTEVQPVEMQPGLFRWVTEDVLFKIIVAELKRDMR